MKTIKTSKSCTHIPVQFFDYCIWDYNHELKFSLFNIVRECSEGIEIVQEDIGIGHKEERVFNRRGLYIASISRSKRISVAG